jgi:hypothetical protein
VLAPTAPAVGARANPGTVAIVGVPPASAGNHVEVCEFRIVGSGFPSGSAVFIDIAGFGRPSSAGPASFSSTLSADADGEFSISGPSLPDGSYRLTVENVDTSGRAKVKNFRVDC